jgi:GNAT superfamily N-acetyltransferase
MWWRKPRADFERGKGENNREEFRTLVAAGPPPGILAYRGAEPVGWCAVAPRRDYVRLERSRVLRPLDAEPVWSVTCFFVARPYRRQGLTVELLKAAMGYVRERGGKVVEGYPLAPRGPAAPAAFVCTGLLSAFLKAGFHEMPRWSEARPIVRCRVEP